MKKIDQIGKMILCGAFVVLMLMGNLTKAQAASFSISASRGSVSPGGTFQVTISGSDCTGRVNLSVSNGTLSESAVWVENSSYTVTVTAGSSGSVSVTATPAEGFSDGNGDIYSPGSRTVSVAIVQPQKPSTSKPSSPSTPSTTTPSVEPQEDTRSKNYNLSSLSVDQGTLTPDFSPEVTQYRVSLPKDAKEITVSAKAQDSAATLSGTGKKTLQAGDNKIEVTCQSEYGTKQVYTINVYVDEEPIVFFDYAGGSYGVVRNTKDVKVPEGFKESKVKVEDEEIVAWTNETMHQTIVYLISSEDEKGFYLLEDGAVTSAFKPVVIAGRTLYQIDVEKDRQTLAGMSFGTVKLKDLEMPGWTYQEEDLAAYCVIYVMNEQGERGYYQYDSAEETLQRYNGLSVSSDAYTSAKTMQYVGFGTAGACALAAIALGVWMAVQARKTKHQPK